MGMAFIVYSPLRNLFILAKTFYNPAAAIFETIAAGTSCPTTT